MELCIPKWHFVKGKADGFAPKPPRGAAYCANSEFLGKLFRYF
jgi:hypothetical protein